MDARVNYVVLPLARRLMRADQAARASGEGYMAGTLMHEISHGLGPVFARVGGKQVDIREALGPVYSGLEEAKADVVGMYGMGWLFGKRAMPNEREREYYDSYLAGIFRTVRFGTGEAHGRAEMMEFNFLFEQGGIQREGGKYVVDYAKIRAGLGKLAKELLEMEATGDRRRAESWMKKYDTMPAELQAALKGASDIPVDVDPIFSFPEQVR
jgi:hypothetical protein